MTAVVERAEKAGKQVKPLIVPTNNPLHAVLKTAMDLQAQELIMGASNKYTADEQLEQIAFYWINLHGGTSAAADRAHPQPRTRHVSRPGRRQPHPQDQRTRRRVRWPSCGPPASASIACCCCTTAVPRTATLFQAVLTMLDPQVKLGLLPVPAHGLKFRQWRRRRPARGGEGRGNSAAPSPVVAADDTGGPAVVERLRADNYDLVILPMLGESPGDAVRSLDELHAVHPDARPLPRIPGGRPGHSAGSRRCDAECFVKW